MALRPLGQPWFVMLSALLLLSLALAACGDDGGKTLVPGGALTDPRSVPVATPWPEPPEPILLEEGAVAPLPEEGEEPAASGETYIVQPGDSPYSICLQFGCDYTELMELNGITDPTTLTVGQELKVPPPTE